MAKRRRKVRKSGGLSGRARKVSKAPRACRVRLSSCMKGRGSRAKASRCMKSFNRCLGR